MSDHKISRQELSAVLGSEANLATSTKLVDGLSEETLLTYLDGGLDAEEESRLQDQLAANPELATKLLQLEALANAEPPSDATARVEVEAGLTDFRHRLAAAESPTGTDTESPLPFRRPGRSWGRRVASIAALAAAVTAAAIWLRPSLQPDSRPVLIGNVRPPLAGGVARSGGASERYPPAGDGVEVELFPDEEKKVELPASQLIYLKLAAGREAESCAARVTLPEDGQERVAGLLPDGFLVFLALNPPRSGRYEIGLRCGEIGGEDHYAVEASLGMGG